MWLLGVMIGNAMMLIAASALVGLMQLGFTGSVRYLSKFRRRRARGSAAGFAE